MLSSTRSPFLAVANFVVTTWTAFWLAIRQACSREAAVQVLWCDEAMVRAGLPGSLSAEHTKDLRPLPIRSLFLPIRVRYPSPPSDSMIRACSLEAAEQDSMRAANYKSRTTYQQGFCYLLIRSPAQNMHHSGTDAEAPGWASVPGRRGGRLRPRRSRWPLDRCRSPRWSRGRRCCRRRHHLHGHRHHRLRGRGRRARRGHLRGGGGVVCVLAETTVLLRLAMGVPRYSDL
mmetsp:Transcript_41277/g.86195  ORF Transcript_41277/g.86195 Transcript_41277/m.86195 type:complete len:231 (+) Transcript_41277:4095-4787(+)